VGADAAALVGRDVPADLAEAHRVLDLDEHLREPAHAGVVGVEQMECDPLRRLGADAWQLAELVDEVLADAFVHGANCSCPGRRGMPRGPGLGAERGPGGPPRTCRTPGPATGACWTLRSPRSCPDTVCPALPAPAPRRPAARPRRGVTWSHCPPPCSTPSASASSPACPTPPPTAPSRRRSPAGWWRTCATRPRPR